MLYDPKWTGTKADPLTLESLISWLEKMPATETYNYEACDGTCLYGLYMASHGIEWDDSGAAGSRASSRERSDFCDLVYEYVAAQRPWTFGDALERARAALT